MSDKNLEIELESSDQLKDFNETIVDTDKLIDNLKTLIDSNNLLSISKDVENIKAQFYIKLKNTEKDKSDIEKKFKKIYNQYRLEKNTLRKKIEKEEGDNLKIKKDIIAEIKELTNNIEIKKETFNHFKELQKKWKDTGYVNLKYKNDLWQTYNHYVEVFYDYLRLNNDLRDIDFKKNLKLKTKICEKAESLILENSLNKMHESLQLLHEEWKNIGPVKKEDREILWQRFQEASKKINKKRNDHYTELKRKDQEKIKLKKEICGKIEAISNKTFRNNTEFKTASNKFNELVEKWKSLGGVNKKDNKHCWKDFREVQNLFYKQKNEFFKKRKENNKKSIQLKSELCNEAKNLENDTNWESSTKKIIKLQDKWKKAGHTFGKASDKLWKEFKSSCDNFFNAKKKEQEKINLETNKKKASKEKIIKKILDFKLEDNTDKNIEFIHSCVSNWKKIGEIKNSYKLEKNFKEVCFDLIRKINISQKEKEKLKQDTYINLIKDNLNEVKKYKLDIKQKITEKKKEIDQYETNKSFFVANKNNNSIKNQIDNKIKKLITETEQLEKELKHLKKL
tara:strand:- start:5383 stop:7080 length:1698 start_codon:yes stop_codon:yes gene_type:complete